MDILWIHILFPGFLKKKLPLLSQLSSRAQAAMILNSCCWLFLQIPLGIKAICTCEFWGKIGTSPVNRGFLWTVRSNNGSSLRMVFCGSSSPPPTPPRLQWLLDCSFSPNCVGRELKMGIWQARISSKLAILTEIQLSLFPVEVPNVVTARSN